MIRNLRELYQYRALLWSLVQRELTGRYRGSWLGFMWTFINPLLLMLVYALIFGALMQQSIPHYTYFVFVGLLPWIWFSTAVCAGASAISDRRDLLTKVRFPAQILPATVVLTNLCNYLLAIPLMVGLGLFSHVSPSAHVIAFPLLLAVQLVFTFAIAMGLAALNVSFRDLQHITNNIVTLWFFVTPVLYLADTIPARYRAVALLINPMATLICDYQAIFYEHRWPDLAPLGRVIVISIVLLTIAVRVFESRREEFAEVA